MIDSPAGVSVTTTARVEHQTYARGCVALAFLGLDAVHIYGRVEVVLLQWCCSKVHQRSESLWLYRKRLPKVKGCAQCMYSCAIASRLGMCMCTQMHAIPHTVTLPLTARNLGPDSPRGIFDAQLCVHPTTVITFISQRLKLMCMHDQS